MSDDNKNYYSFNLSIQCHIFKSLFKSSNDYHYIIWGLITLINNSVNP